MDSVPQSRGEVKRELEARVGVRLLPFFPRIDFRVDRLFRGRRILRVTGGFEVFVGRLLSVVHSRSLVSPVPNSVVVTRIASNDRTFQ